MGDDVVFVTGSRTGIGRHLVEHFVAQGRRVVGCSRSPAEFTLEGYHHLQADVTVEDDVIRVMQFIESEFGRLDILVNNAGIASMNHVLLTTSATVARTLDTNVRSVFIASREAAKIMRRRKFGRIVSIGSIAAPLRVAGETVYAASKAAVVTMMQLMAYELAPYGITCNTVSPTPIDTDLIRGVPKEKIAALVDRLAIKRLGKFEDVSNAVDFFVDRK
ncbi:MAG: SDR family oxidoreductase, partial [Gemmatimonadaceae bacterium]